MLFYFFMAIEAHSIFIIIRLDKTGLWLDFMQYIEVVVPVKSVFMTVLRI